MALDRPFIGLGDETVFVVTAHMPDKTVVVGAAKSEYGAQEIERKAARDLDSEPALEFEITEVPIRW